MYFQKVISRKTFLLASWRSRTKIAESGSIGQRHGSADPDPYGAKVSRIHNTVLYFPWTLLPPAQWGRCSDGWENSAWPPQYGRRADWRSPSAPAAGTGGRSEHPRLQLEHSSSGLFLWKKEDNLRFILQDFKNSVSGAELSILWFVDGGSLLLDLLWDLVLMAGNVGLEALRLPALLLLLFVVGLLFSVLLDKKKSSWKTSVGEPNPCVFGPPGSATGSVSHKYGSDSGSFHHQAKIVRKTLISTVLWFLYDFLSLKN